MVTQSQTIKKAQEEAAKVDAAQVAQAARHALATKGPAAVGEVLKDEWDMEDVDSSDMLIPKLLIMQAPSKLVAQEKAQMGDIVNSVSSEVIGTCREKDFKPVQFIPIKEEKTWTEFELVGSKAEFRASVPRNAGNDSLPREFEKDGKKHIRYRTLNYFVLLVKELMNSDMPLPYALSFRSTGFKAGRVLSTHFLMCKAALQKGKVVAPPATVFKLGGVKTSNDKGTFYVPEVQHGEAAKPEWVAIAAQWLKTLRTKAYSVDESETGEVAVEVTIRDVKPGEVSAGEEF